MTKQTTNKGGKKGRKFGRNVAFCLSYKAQRRRERNKKRTLVRHVKNHPFDESAFEALRQLGTSPQQLAELQRGAMLKRMDKDERYYANWRRREMQGVNMQQAELEIAAFLMMEAS